MKRSLILAMLMMVSILTFAQKERKSPVERAAKQTDRMKSELSLSDQQYASIKGINEQYATKREALFKDQSLKGEERKAQSKELRVNQEKEINSVLTPEQKTKLDVLKKERAEKHKAKRIERGKTRAENIKKELALTDDQQQKMLQTTKAFKEKREKIKTDNSLTEENRKAAYKNLKNEYQSEVKGILSEEQFTNWQTMKAERKGKRHGKRK